MHFHWESVAPSQLQKDMRKVPHHLCYQYTPGRKKAQLVLWVFLENARERPERNMQKSGVSEETPDRFLFTGEAPHGV